MSFERGAALGGLVAVVLLILSAGLLGDQPTRDDPVADVTEYLGTNQGPHRLSLILGFLAGPLFAVFIAALAAKLWQEDRERDEAWGIVLLLGFVGVAGAVTIGDSLTAVLFLRGGDGLDEAVVQALYDGQFVAYSLAGIALTAMTGAAGMGALQRASWPTWYGWLSMVAAVAGLISVGGVMWTAFAGELLGAAPFIALLIWVLASSFVLYRDRQGLPGTQAI